MNLVWYWLLLLVALGVTIWNHIDDSTDKSLALLLSTGSRGVLALPPIQTRVIDLCILTVLFAVPRIRINVTSIKPLSVYIVFHTLLMLLLETLPDFVMLILVAVVSVARLASIVYCYYVLFKQPLEFDMTVFLYGVQFMVLWNIVIAVGLIMSAAVGENTSVYVDMHSLAVILVAMAPLTMWKLMAGGFHYALHISILLGLYFQSVSSTLKALVGVGAYIALIDTAILCMNIGRFWRNTHSVAPQNQNQDWQSLLRDGAFMMHDNLPIAVVPFSSITQATTIDIKEPPPPPAPKKKRAAGLGFSRSQLF